MYKFIILMVLSFAAAAAADDWTTQDTQREVAYQIVAAMDWAQTRNIARNPDRWYETNAILGKHPSTDKVDAYFAVMALAHYFVSDAFPVEYRAAWQYVSIGFEIGYVKRNLELGIGIKF